MLTDLLCTAVPRSIVDRLLTACRAAKLELVGIHDEFTTLLRAFAAASPTVDDSGVTTVYLDIGAVATELVIAHGSSWPSRARSTPAGCSSTSSRARAWGTTRSVYNAARRRRVGEVAAARS